MGDINKPKRENKSGQMHRKWTLKAIGGGPFCVWCSASVFALSRSLLTDGCTVREIFRNRHVCSNFRRMHLGWFWSDFLGIRQSSNAPRAKNLDSIYSPLANFAFFFHASRRWRGWFASGRRLRPDSSEHSPPKTASTRMSRRPGKRPTRGQKSVSSSWKRPSNSPR